MEFQNKFCSPGNVSVTNEDYNCLEAEQFLNDVIIDFYLKYIQVPETKIN